MAYPIHEIGFDGLSVELLCARAGRDFRAHITALHNRHIEDIRGPGLPGSTLQWNEPDQ